MGKDAAKPWPPPRDKWFPGYTATRDGWARWHAGQTIYCGGKRATRQEVEDTFAAKRDLIDQGEALAQFQASSALTYREAIAEYLTVQKARVGAARDRIEERTYFNLVTALNAFGNFEFDGSKIADLALVDIGPAQFSAYAQSFGKWRASGFDSIVSRVGSLFRWAVEMEYIDRYRPGPLFVRPDKQELRDQRIGQALAFTAKEIATAYHAANVVQKCWIALGTCAAFINSDVAHATHQVMGLGAGIIDFRRRKAGKVRRVIPLPPDVQKLLASYRRPDPADPAHTDLFFLSEQGRPYSLTRNANGKPSCTLSRLMARLLTDCGVKKEGDRRNFKSFRTAFYNLAPRGQWELERKIVMGRAQGTVDLDSYLEDIGLDRLRHVVNHVWDQVTKELEQINKSHQD